VQIFTRHLDGVVRQEPLFRALGVSILLPRNPPTFFFIGRLREGLNKTET